MNVITVSREYGAGGGEVARRLAEFLGWELLDREKDPLEVKNFYDDPAYTDTVKELRAEIERLRDEIKETGEPPRTAYGDQPFDNETQPSTGGKKPKK